MVHMTILVQLKQNSSHRNLRSSRRDKTNPQFWTYRQSNRKSKTNKLVLLMTDSTPWQDTTQDKVTTAVKAVIDQIKIDMTRTSEFRQAMTTGFLSKRGADITVHQQRDWVRWMDAHVHTQMKAPFMKTPEWIVHYAWWPSGNSTGWVTAACQFTQKTFSLSYCSDNEIPLFLLCSLKSPCLHCSKSYQTKQTLHRIVWSKMCYDDTVHMAAGHDLS